MTPESAVDRISNLTTGEYRLLNRSAQYVVERAEQVARTNNHRSISSDDFLVALAESQQISQFFEAEGVRAGGIQIANTRESTHWWDEPAPYVRNLPLTENGSGIIAGAFRIALRRGEETATPKDLLASLLDQAVHESPIPISRMLLVAAGANPQRMLDRVSPPQDPRRAW